MSEELFDIADSIIRSEAEREIKDREFATLYPAYCAAHSHGTVYLELRGHNWHIRCACNELSEWSGEKLECDICNLPIADPCKWVAFVAAIAAHNDYDVSDWYIDSSKPVKCSSRIDFPASFGKDYSPYENAKFLIESTFGVSTDELPKEEIRKLYLAYCATKSPSVDIEYDPRSDTWSATCKCHHMSLSCGLCGHRVWGWNENSALIHLTAHLGGAITDAVEPITPHECHSLVSSVHGLVEG